MKIFKKYMYAALSLVAMSSITYASDTSTKCTNMQQYEHKRKASFLEFHNRSSFAVKLVSKSDPDGTYPPKCNGYSGPEIGTIIPPGDSSVKIEMVGAFSYGDHGGKYVSGCQLEFEILNANYIGKNEPFYISIARDQTAPGFHGAGAKLTWMEYAAGFDQDIYIHDSIESVSPTYKDNFYLIGNLPNWESPDQSSSDDAYSVTLSEFPAGSCDASSSQPIYHPNGTLDSANPLTISSCDGNNGFNTYNCSKKFNDY